ncbi:hypothetical protein [Flavobacterium commune]|uniref:Uncharacterized protein n=1 Tax=Flavobacterium commune TaxID=1306519 RepID=A0A1D9PDL2_9FLAO|nr:hypothetical protein [Flavobacterium commune]APA00216.1 hypothetical protein BIW12_12695 [Flavobacterium commune]
MAEDKKESKDWKKEILEWAGISIITVIILAIGITLFARSCSKIKNENVYIDTLHISKIKYFEISQKKIDTNYIALNKELINNLYVTTDSINSKIVKINKVSSDLKEIQKESTETFRFYLTVIGFIFAIVGFFGFKSIFDTRQAAIERAVFDAKNIAESKAKEIAEIESKRISGEKAKEVAEEIAKSESQKIAKSEIKIYFDDKFNGEMTTRLNEYYDNREERITNIEEEIDKLKRPEAYGLLTNDNKTTEFNNKIIEIEKRYIDLLSLVSDIKSKQ